MKLSFPKTIMSVSMILIMSVMTNSALAGKPVIHGIISQGYLKSTEYNYLIPSKDGSFAMNEVMINISASVTDNLRVGAQIIGRNLGADGNENVVVDWAYGDYRFRDELGVRIGKVKTPHGLYNQTRDVDMVRNSILLPQSVYTESMRDVMNGFEGISAYGSVSMGDATSFEYDAFVGTVDAERTGFGANIVQDVIGNIYGSPLPMTGWTSETKTIYGGALRWNTPLEGLRAGATALAVDLYGQGSLFGPLGIFSPHLELDVKSWYVLSAEYTWEDLILSFEYNRVDSAMDVSDILVPTGLPAPAPPTTTIDVNLPDRRGGWYGQGTYRINDWFELGGYYSIYYPDYSNRDSDSINAKQTDIALTARFDVTDYWLIKVEGHAMDGTGDVDSALNPDPSGEENWTLFGVKSTFYF